MTFQEQLEIAIPLAVGALGGLAVGIEREWSARVEGEPPRFAGVRTFLLIGLLGALAVRRIHGCGCANLHDRKATRFERGCRR